MATVNFSVPQEVKQEFNRTFAGRNKSAVIAELMREAIERAQARKRSEAACKRILKRRKRAPVATDKRIREARTSGRP